MCMCIYIYMCIRAYVRTRTLCMREPWMYVT